MNNTSILLPNIGDIVTVPGSDKRYKVVDYRNACLSFYCKDVDGICTWFDGRDLVVIERKEPTLEDVICGCCRTANQVEHELNRAGIPYTRDNEGTGFIIWRNAEGYTRIYKPFKRSGYIFQVWKKHNFEYSGIPVFEPSGRRSL